MKLETPRLDEFVELARIPGTEIWFTVQTPSGENRSINVNALFVEVHAALHSLHHFMDLDGAHHPYFPVIPRPVRPEDNPTNPGGAALGSP